MFDPCDFRLLMPVVSLTKNYNIDSNNSYCFILVDEYEGLLEELHLQSKCFLDLLIVKEDLSALSNPDRAQHNVHYVLLLFIILFKMSYIN